MFFRYLDTCSRYLNGSGGPQDPDLEALLLSGRAPEGLRISGGLQLSGSRIRRLPARMTIGGDLDLTMCSRLRVVGDGLRVAGSLRIGGRVRGETRGSARPSWGGQTPLLGLPEDLVVEGDLELRSCRRLKRLPHRIEVGGSLRIEGASALEALPDDLRVKGDLVLIGCRALRSLPAGLRVDRDFRLDGSPVQEIPRDFRVGRDLRLLHCPGLRRLPEDLAVGRRLEIESCGLVVLPPGLQVKGSLFLTGLPLLVETSARLVVPGTLIIHDCRALRKLGEGLVIGRDLIVLRCRSLAELPAGLSVPGTMDLTESSSLSALPARLSVGRAAGRRGRLVLTKCLALASLPEDLSVHGTIEVAASSVRIIPESLASRIWGYRIGPVPYPTTLLTWRGVAIPPHILSRAESLDALEIMAVPNAELRRVLLENREIEDVLRAAGARTIHADTNRGGDRRLLSIPRPPNHWSLRIHRPRGRNLSAKAIVCLWCRCPTTGQEYLLRVPPLTRTCHQAAAWLARFNRAKD